jgi:dihydroorotase
MALVEPGHLSWPKLIEKLAVNPGRILKLDRGTLQPGADADVTLIDPAVPWTIDPQQFRSKSRNSPFGGLSVRGRARLVILGGEVKE